MKPESYNCACEYPCSCIKYDGKTFSGSYSVIEYLESRVDELEKTLADLRQYG